MENDNYTEVELDVADDEGETQTQESASSGNGVREELVQRCRAAGIECSDHERLAGRAGFRPVKVTMPSGRKTRDIIAFSENAAQALLSVPFEKYRFLEGYDAICSFQDGIIEARVTPTSRSIMPTSFILERLLGVRDRLGDESIDEAQLVLPSTSQAGISLRLGSGSDAFNALTRLERFKYASERIQSAPLTLTITITGLKISQHDQAILCLNKAASSLFFELDLTFDLALSLVRRRSGTRQHLPRRNKPDINSMQFPKSEYDKTPISLYWYARSAERMPLLQFLAFYQVLEYYFPTYSDQEALGRLQRILKEPTFNAHNSSHVVRLLQAVKSHSGKGFGGERDQLSATLRGCLDANELLDFACADEDRKVALTSKGKLSDHKLPLTRSQGDVLKNAADRIYDIRCRIVHTKNGDDETEVTLLLPNSEEADSLGYDIELVQFIAQRVLIANSRPLSL